MSLLLTPDRVDMTTQHPQRSPEYQRAHYRVKQSRGRADSYLCENECGRQAHDWAWTHETDPDDPANYRPLCQSCHAIYDERGPKMTGDPTAPAAPVKAVGDAFKKRRQLAQRLADQDLYIGEAVRQARAAGHTWAEMARAADVSDVAILKAARRPAA